jgi:hypothetical protein
MAANCHRGQAMGWSIFILRLGHSRFDEVYVKNYKLMAAIIQISALV